jgi:hypothetical protein
MVLEVEEHAESDRRAKAVAHGPRQRPRSRAAVMHSPHREKGGQALAGRHRQQVKR